MSKRLLSILLCLSLILAVLVSCNSEPKGFESSTTSGIKVTTAKNPLSSDGKSISLDGYQLVYSIMISRAAKDYIQQVNRDLPTELTPRPDSTVAEKEIANEIIVGNSSRALTAEYAEELRRDEFLIRYNPTNHRIYIIGSDDAQTLAALEYFFETLLTPDKSSITFPDATTSYIKRNELMLASYKINGVDIDDYTVIYPKNADNLTLAAAENIADYFDIALGVEVKVSSDSLAETEHEILVGDTNRDEDDISFSMSSSQYVMFTEGTKIVFRGKGYMIGGGFGMMVKESIDITKTKQEISVQIPTDKVARKYVFADKCTSAILMIGDGMGFNHIQHTLDEGVLPSFAAQSFPNQGSAVTRSHTVLIGNAAFTDSAASGTALATGYKTHNGYIGKAPDGTDVQNLRELAHAFGAQTAVVSTDAITGATPGAFLAHVNDRNDSSTMTSQINTLKNNMQVDYVKGTADGSTEGILKRDTREALMTIADSADPFFIMVEEGYIDKHSHGAGATNVRNAVKRFDEAIAYAACFALCHPGTALIVTADHETGGIIKASSLDDVRAQGISESKISAYGEKMTYHIEKYGYCFTSYTSSTGTEHTNADVPVYAFGPDTEIFHAARTENIDIARFIAKAYGADSFGQTNPVE